MVPMLRPSELHEITFLHGHCGQTGLSEPVRPSELHEITFYADKACYMRLLFCMVTVVRPSELQSSGVSCWTPHGLGIMVMQLPALCVFKHRTLSLHPCCVCVSVCVCVRESFSLTSVGRNDWFTVQEGYLVTHMTFWRDVTFLTLRNTVTQLKALPVGTGSYK